MLILVTILGFAGCGKSDSPTAPTAAGGPATLSGVYASNCVLAFDFITNSTQYYIVDRWTVNGTQVSILRTRYFNSTCTSEHSHDDFSGPFSLTPSGWGNSFQPIDIQSNLGPLFGNIQIQDASNADVSALTDVSWQRSNIMTFHLKK